jgi:hypothetical protein
MVDQRVSALIILGLIVSAFGIVVALFGPRAVLWVVIMAGGFALVVLLAALQARMGGRH